MREIVVIGAGFAGFNTVKALERGLIGRRRVRLTLINDRAHFLFTPLLPNVANGQLKLHSITLPLREHLDETTRFVLGKVSGVDMKQGKIYLDDQPPLSFDYLVMAPGAQVNWHGHEDWRPHAMTCKDAHDATAIYETLERVYTQAAQTSDEAQRRELLTFCFAGAGPAGIELAAELYATIQRRILPYASDALMKSTRFIIVDPQDNPLGSMPEALQARVGRHLDRLGIELRLGVSATERDARRLVLSNNEEIATQTFFWCAGVKAPALLSELDGVTLGPDGRALVNSYLHASDGLEHALILGDSALSPEPHPQSAQVAVQQAPIAAHNLLASMSGRSPTPWHYQSQGELLTLGRGQALAHAKHLVLEGKAAYALYRLVYASLMPGSFKKWRVLKDWLEDDLRNQDQPLLALPS